MKIRKNFEKFFKLKKKFFLIFKNFKKFLKIFENLQKNFQKNFFKKFQKISRKFFFNFSKKNFFLSNFRGLLPISKDGHADPYITLRLIPIEGQRGLASAGSVSPGKGGRKQTKIVENCLNPIFNEM